MAKEKYVGTTYDVFLKDTRTKNGEETSIILIGKNKADVIRQAFYIMGLEQDGYF